MLVLQLCAVREAGKQVAAMTCREAASAELQHSLLQEVLMALQKLDLTTSGVGMLPRTQTAPRGSVGCSACSARQRKDMKLPSHMANQLHQSMPLTLWL